MLGAHLLLEQGDLVDVVGRVARERGTTYILIGPPRPRGALRRLLGPSLVDRLLRELPGVDVRVVADRTRRGTTGGEHGARRRVVALGGALAAASRGAGAAAPPRLEPGAHRILFPVVGSSLSAPALDAALRIARAEHATLVPGYLASVPMHLPLDAALPRACEIALPVLEAVEQRAAAAGVPVDSRIERGRGYRHALAELIDHERYDRIVVAAGANGEAGFSAEDVAWLLAHAPGEIVVLRPGNGRGVLARPGVRAG